MKHVFKYKPNIEKFLIKNKFTIDRRYNETKLYMRNITEHQILYVMIFADVNQLVRVSCEDNDEPEEKIIILETINSYKKLKMLVKALF